MRPEKKYLVDELNGYIEGSEYVFLTNFERVTVEETAQLRAVLEEHDAEFHVVKNRILRVAAAEREMPDLADMLSGQTAIVVGGPNAPAVAKALLKFHKDKEKNSIKGGVIGSSVLPADQFEEFSETPPLEVLQAQLLGLLNQPAQKMVMLLNVVPTDMVSILAAVPRSMLNVLNQKQAKDAAA